MVLKAETCRGLLRGDTATIANVFVELMDFGTATPVREVWMVSARGKSGAGASDL